MTSPGLLIHCGPSVKSFSPMLVVQKFISYLLSQGTALIELTGLFLETAIAYKAPPNGRPRYALHVEEENRLGIGSAVVTQLFRWMVQRTVATHFQLNVRHRCQGCGPWFILTKCWKIQRHSVNIHIFGFTKLHIVSMWHSEWFWGVLEPLWMLLLAQISLFPFIQCQKDLTL